MARAAIAGDRDGVVVELREVHRRVHVADADEERPLAEQLGRQPGVLLEVDDHLEVAAGGVVLVQVAERLHHRGPAAVDGLARERVRERGQQVAQRGNAHRGHDEQARDDETGNPAAPLAPRRLGRRRSRRQLRRRNVAPRAFLDDPHRPPEYQCDS